MQAQGIVFGTKVACPMHNWHIQFESGKAVAPDVGCARKFEVKMEGEKVLVELG